MPTSLEVCRDSEESLSNSVPQLSPLLSEAGSYVSTRSIWGSAHPRIYNFLDKVEQTGLLKTLCVIGSADGAEVFPAAKRGFLVTAIEQDGDYLDGGTRQINSETVAYRGMRYWLKQDGNEDRVHIIEDNFMSVPAQPQYAGVLVSGVIHYESNMRYTLDSIIQKIQSFVILGGVLLIEYAHPSERNNGSDNYYLTAPQIVDQFDEPDWIITSNKVKSYRDKPNPRNPYPHDVVWGKLYAKKIAESKP